VLRSAFLESEYTAGLAPMLDLGTQLAPMTLLAAELRNPSSPLNAPRKKVYANPNPNPKPNPESRPNPYVHIIQAEMELSPGRFIQKRLIRKNSSFRFLWGGEAAERREEQQVRLRVRVSFWVTLSLSHSLTLSLTQP